MKQIDRTGPIVVTAAVSSPALFESQSVPLLLNISNSLLYPMPRGRCFDGAGADAGMTCKSAQVIWSRAHLRPYMLAYMPKKQAAASGVAAAVGAATPWTEQAVAQFKFKFGRHPLICAAATALLLAAGCAGPVKVGPDAVAGLTPDGTVEVQQVQAAFIGSGGDGNGNGMLYYRGNAYPFTVAGLGVGGIGVSTPDADGEVYKLNSVTQFPGAYAQGRYGFALGNKSGGDLWLQNESGVIMHLHAKREGLMLSLGGDAVVISMR
jgi:hypothetical protein